MPEQNIDDKIQGVYKIVDQLARDGRLGRLDYKLGMVDVGFEPADILLAWLVATLPVASQLPTRSNFRELVADALRSRGEWEPRILDGL